MSPLLVHERATAAYLFPTGFLFVRKLMPFLRKPFHLYGVRLHCLSVCVCSCLCPSLSVSAYHSLCLLLCPYLPVSPLSLLNPLVAHVTPLLDALLARIRRLALRIVSMMQLISGHLLRIYRVYSVINVMQCVASSFTSIFIAQERERESEICFIFSVFAAICLLFFM